MGEIDTSSIESVQAALCYFGEKNDLKKPYRDDSDTLHKGLIDDLHKELANYKVQLEAKGSQNLQALLNLQHYQRTVHELSSKLEECEAERDACMAESRDQIQRLEIEMADQMSQASKVKEQLWHVTELISLRNQMVQDLEHQLLSNSLFIQSLQSELQQATELSSCIEETVEDLKAKLEDEESRASMQALYIESLNMEQGLLRMELKNTKEDTQFLSCRVENLAKELEGAKLELSERENELQREIAMLKEDLHKSKSEMGAAATYEATGINVSSAGKAELKLKHEATSEQENTFTFHSVDNIVAIPVREYERLLAAKANGAELRNEVEVLKKEQEASTIKVNEFGTRAEQAVSRAESAERAKAAVEGQLRKWREQKQKRKAATAALKQETHTLQPQPIYGDSELPVGKYQPLGKVLNMKF